MMLLNGAYLDMKILLIVADPVDLGKAGVYNLSV
jgi:hypothetical protein